MKKTIIAVTTVVVVGLGSSFFSDSVHANTINDLSNKQTEVQNERNSIKASLSKADAEIADILFDLKELNQEIIRVDDALKENQAMMKEAKDGISKTEEEIALLEEEVSKLEESIEERNEILKRRIISYQKTGGSIGFLEVIFGSKNFNEFISRTTAVTKITNSDAELMKEQEEEKAEVEVGKKKVELKLAEQNEMKVELEGMEALILVQKEQNDASKKELEKKETKINTLKAELVNKDSNLASVEAQIRRDIAAARAPRSSTTVAQSGNAGNLVTLGSKSTNSNNNVSAPASKPTATKGSIGTAINAGYKHLGTPYRWAGKSPSGFDCSGFVSWAYGQAGYSIPSSTSGLSVSGQKVSYSNIQPGDLVFFNTYKVNGHVGIYIGGGQFIGSQNSTGLAVASMSSTYWKNAFKGHVRRVN